MGFFILRHQSRIKITAIVHIVGDREPFFANRDELK